MWQVRKRTYIMVLRYSQYWIDQKFWEISDYFFTVIMHSQQPQLYDLQNISHTERGPRFIYKKCVCVFLKCLKLVNCCFWYFWWPLDKGGNPYEWNPHNNRCIKDPGRNAPMKCQGSVESEIVTVEVWSSNDHFLNVK